MIRSIGEVHTELSARYAKQLVSHLGHKVAVEEVAGDAEARRLVFAYGSGVIRSEAGRLVMEAEAADEEALARVQDVLSRHLVKFGRRNELQVSWLPSS
jgi:hypothetical protein